MPEATWTDRPAKALVPAPRAAVRTPPTVPPQRLAWIDVTRGLAIVAVLVYHTLGFLQVPNRLNAQAGVDAFLLISGFGLAYGLRPEPWHAFLGRRLLKLLPAYWLVLALCVGFELWRGQVVPLGRLALQVACLHLAAGDPHGFAINDSFWFMGLIVPLYAWFALIRRWVSGPAAYAALGTSAALAWVGGVLVFEYGQAWGMMSVGHAPPRAPVFFLGAVAGILFRRRDPAERLAGEPLLLAALVLIVPVSIAGDWNFFPFALLTGLGIVAAGMFVSSAGERWAIARPLTLLLAGIGAVAFELYLCHQYLLVTVNTRLLLPRLAEWFPRMTPFGRNLMSACLALAVAVWVAWLIRWVVSWRESRRTCRATLPAVAVLSVGLVLTGFVLPARIPKDRPRTFQVAVTLAAAPPAAAAADPVVSFGHSGAGDLVFVQHDGTGRARIGVDHWGTPTEWTNWLPVGELTAVPWEVRIDSSGVGVRAGEQRVRSAGPPYVPNAKPVFGRNDPGFATAAPRATYLRVTRLGSTTGPATAPAVR